MIQQVQYAVNTTTADLKILVLNVECTATTTADLKILALHLKSATTTDLKFWFSTGMHNNNNNRQSENSGCRSEVSNSCACQYENSSPQPECMSQQSAEEEYATVHMLQAARLSGRHEKLVKLQFNKQDVVSTGDFSPGT